MTSEFSAASLRSTPGTAGREGLKPMPLLLIGVVFAIAIGLRQVVPLNTDVSWLLVIGERMLDGLVGRAHHCGGSSLMVSLPSLPVKRNGGW